MKSAIGTTLVLLIVVLLAWLVFEHDETPRNSTLSEPVVERAEARSPVTDLAVEVQPSLGENRIEFAEAPRPNSPESSVRNDTLSVRSSIGLSLPFIEWRASETDWRRIDLDHGRCSIGPKMLPCLVRAPGHVATTASNAGEEIVLEPDALLLLESKDLRSCASWIRPYEIGIGLDEQEWGENRLSPALRRAVAWGWLSDDRWAFAVSSELAPESIRTDDPQAVVRWRDGRRADVYFIVKPGARGTWSVPCENVAPSADLEVRVIRSDAQEAGPVRARLWRIDGSSDGHPEKYPWGRIYHYSTDNYVQSLMIPASADSARFESVPTGVDISLALRDEITSCYGRLVFTHDGTARTLKLRPPFEVTGRAVSSEPSTPVTTMDWWWDFREGKIGVLGWRAGTGGLVLPPDGGFRLRGPGQALISNLAPLDPPAHMLLHIEATGFESFEKLFDTGGATRFDCGEIVLVPRRGEIVLAPGHGLSPSALQWAVLKLPETPEFVWKLRNAALMPDGALEIFAVRSEKQPTLFETHPPSSRAWPETASERILIHLHFGATDPPWGFERGIDGRYIAVPRQEFEAEVECRALPSEGKSWFIGWQWHGLWDTCDQVPAYELGQTVSVRFSMPAEGATIFWSGSGDPPRAGNEPGGSSSAEALRGKIILQ